MSKVQPPFIHGTTNMISHILKKKIVYGSFKPLNTIKNSLRSVKYLVDPKHMKGV